MSSNVPELKIAGRRLRASVTWWLALALVLAMAHLVHSPAPARAEEGCFLDQTGGVTCPDPATPAEAPSSLLSEAAYQDMTSSQAAALRRFEEQAVNAVLKLHGLPASDAIDVRFWARDEATGLLQKLVFRAVSTRPDQRTFDQRQVAAWIAELWVARTRPGVLQAGAEYAVWAGLSVSRYWELVNGGASKQELTTFLSRTPQPYNGTSPSTSTSGFCKYVPPAPYADQYDVRGWHACFTPCLQTISDCVPPMTPDQFMSWGQARVTAGSAAFSDKVSATSATLSAAGSVVAIVGGEILGKGVDGVNTLLSVVNAFSPPVPTTSSYKVWTAQDIQAALPRVWEGPDGSFANSLQNEMKNLFRPTKVVVKDLRQQVAFLRNPRNVSHLQPRVGSVVYNMREGIAQGIEARIARMTSRLFTYLGLSAEALVTAFTTIIDATIMLVEDTKLPGEIASNVAYYRSLSIDPIDPIALVLLPQGWAAVRNLFANAVVRESPDDSDCGEQCPAPTPVRAAVPTAPHFMVQAPGAPTWTQTSSLRLGKDVDDRWTATSVRASGRWMVERWYDEDYGLDLQSLELHYTNWEMQPETVWPILHEDGEYSYFIVSPEKTATFNLATCKVDHTCWTTNSIHYLNPDGNPRVAFLESYQPPTGSPTASALAPLLGRAVTFNAGNFAPGDPRGMVTYRWRFQKEGCLASCTIVEGGRTVPDYSAAVAGPVVTRTWQTPGSYQVELTATDGVGHTAVKTLTVNVASG